MPSTLGHPGPSLSGVDEIGPAVIINTRKQFAGDCRQWEQRGGGSLCRGRGRLENLVAEEHLGQGLLPGLSAGRVRPAPSSWSLCLITGKRPHPASGEGPEVARVAGDDGDKRQQVGKFTCPESREALVNVTWDPACGFSFFHTYPHCPRARGQVAHLCASASPPLKWEQCQLWGCWRNT